MSKVLRRLGQTLPATMTALLLGACGSSSTTTSPTAAQAVSAAKTVAAAEEIPSSITVQGTVVDSSNRPLANVEVECMGDVQCAAFGNQVSQQDGPDNGVRTNAAGAYLIVATARSSGARFLMGASGQSYEVSIHEMAFPATFCASGQAGCTIALDFTLTPRAD
jgi:hypothetical protein